MDHTLDVRVLHGSADLDEQAHAVGGGQQVLIAKARDGDTAHQLHDKVGAAALCGPSIQHAGNVGVLHECQRLTLLLKPGDHLAGIHAGFDDL